MSHTYHKDRDGFYRVRDEEGRLICRDITVEKTAKLHAAAPRMLEELKRLCSHFHNSIYVKEARAMLAEIEGKEE